MASEDPIAGISLTHYAEVIAHATGATENEQFTSAAEDLGIAPATWAVAQQGWAERLAAAGQASALYRRFQQHYVAALAERHPETRPLSFDDYVNCTVAAYLGQPAEAIAEALGYDVGQYNLVCQRWLSQLNNDSLLYTHFGLRVQKGLVEQQDQGDAAPIEWIPGGMVRARKCFCCGALKATVSPTAYVYCDYCGTLFDYDIRKESADPSALVPEEVEEALGGASNDLLRAAFRAGDREEYARLIRWRTEVMIDVCPQCFSPRVSDPDYRRRLVDDLLVPWRTVTRFDERYMQTSRQIDALQEEAMQATISVIGELNAGAAPSTLEPRRQEALQKVLRLLARSQAAWAYEADLLEDQGILARHPDGLDRETFLYINASTAVRPWLSLLLGDDGRHLMEAAGVTAEYVEAPKMVLKDCGCGQCGNRLRIPTGAKRTVCCFCGFMLDPRQRSIACSQCGAPVVLPAEKTAQTQFSCAFCGASWVL